MPVEIELTAEQRDAAKILRAALIRCYRVGLSGGVYGDSGSVILWPAGLLPDPQDARNIFAEAENRPKSMVVINAADTRMFLGTGAGA